MPEQLAPLVASKPTLISCSKELITEGFGIVPAVTGSTIEMAGIVMPTDAGIVPSGPDPGDH
jgi:hypothetical protein